MLFQSKDLHWIIVWLVWNDIWFELLVSFFVCWLERWNNIRKSLGGSHGGQLARRKWADPRPTFPSNPHPFKLTNWNYSECLSTTKGHCTARLVQHAASSEQRIFKWDILETRLCSALVGLLEALATCSFSLDLKLAESQKSSSQGTYVNPTQRQTDKGTDNRRNGRILDSGH